MFGSIPGNPLKWWSRNPTAEVDAIGGTARCDGGLGSALPPGRYDAVAEVSGVGVNGSDGSSTPPPTYDTSFDSFEIVSG